MKLFTLFLLFGCALSGKIVKDVSDSNWDEIIDQAIDAAKSDVIVNHYERIQVPNVDKEFYFYILNIIPSYVNVSLHGAELGDITSMIRRKHVTVLQDDVSGNVTVATSLGLDKLYLNSSELHFHVIGINSNGSVIATCGSNELEISLSLITDKQNNCIAQINWARVTKFEDFKVLIKPLTFNNFLGQNILRIALNRSLLEVLEFINSHLTDKLNAVLSKIDVCSFLPI